MTKTWLTATAALTLMMGVAMAETTTTTTTTERTMPYYPPAPTYVAPVVPLTPAPVTETMTERTVEPDGVVHSKTTTVGTAVSPYGDTTTRRVTTETTTVR
jgi:hypothetical protein